jgi:phosphatidate cytidylyltransferase
VLRTRALTAAILIPIAVGLIYLGGFAFLALVAVMLSLAEAEFCRLMAQDEFRPTLVFGIGLVWLFLLNAQLPELDILQPGLTLILLASLAWQMAHRQGSPVADWALTITGGLYLGVCGACMINIRSLNDGFWWMLTILFAIICADSGAYFIGRAWGRHKMVPSLSPGKTWEGYIAGVIIGVLLTVLMVSLWRTQINGAIIANIVHGSILGLLISTLAPLGDLAISMVKRQVGAKDSGNIIPGHGGALDRLDSLLWTAVISYYYIMWFAI